MNKKLCHTTITKVVLNDGTTKRPCCIESKPSQVGLVYSTVAGALEKQEDTTT